MEEQEEQITNEETNKLSHTSNNSNMENNESKELRKCIRKGDRICYSDLERITVLKKIPKKDGDENADIDKTYEKLDSYRSGESVFKTFTFEQTRNINDPETQKCIDFWKNVMEKNLTPIKCTLIEGNVKQPKRSKIQKKSAQTQAELKEPTADIIQQAKVSEVWANALKEIKRHRFNSIKLLLKEQCALCKDTYQYNDEKQKQLQSSDELNNIKELNKWSLQEQHKKGLESTPVSQDPSIQKEKDKVNDVVELDSQIETDLSKNKKNITKLSKNKPKPVQIESEKKTSENVAAQHLNLDIIPDTSLTSLQSKQDSICICPSLNTTCASYDCRNKLPKKEQYDTCVCATDEGICTNIECPSKPKLAADRLSTSTLVSSENTSVLSKKELDKEKIDKLFIFDHNGKKSNSLCKCTHSHGKANKCDKCKFPDGISKVSNGSINIRYTNGNGNKAECVCGKKEGIEVTCLSAICDKKLSTIPSCYCKPANGPPNLVCNSNLCKNRKPYDCKCTNSSEDINCLADNCRKKSKVSLKVSSKVKPLHQPGPPLDYDTSCICKFGGTLMETNCMADNCPKKIKKQFKSTEAPVLLTPIQIVDQPSPNTSLCLEKKCEARKVDCDCDVNECICGRKESPTEIICPFTKCSLKTSKLQYKLNETKKCICAHLNELKNELCKEITCSAKAENKLIEDSNIYVEEDKRSSLNQIKTEIAQGYCFICQKLDCSCHR